MNLLRIRKILSRVNLWSNICKKVDGGWRRSPICLKGNCKMITEQKFQLGQVVMTRSINNTINESAKFAQFVLGSLRSHASGVWGDLCEEDKKENEYALGKYLRIFSSYDCLEDRNSSFYELL